MTEHKPTQDWRDEPIEYGRWMKLWRKYYAGVILGGIGLIIIAFGFVFLYPAEGRTFSQFMSDLYANGGAELVSIAITVLVIDYLNDQRAEKQEKDDLISQMGSDDNAFAREAVRKLRRKEWLYDGTLEDAYLSWANLRGVDLREAIMRQADLGEAILSGADLSGVDLSGANMREAELSVNINDLSELDLAWDNDMLLGALLYEANLSAVNLEQADLKKAELKRANLTGAYLFAADLRKADLTESNLSGAILDGANLQGARLTGANLSGAIMPNGEEWHQGMDLKQFTNPEHPNFWRSDNPNSPAYRGDEGE